MRCPRAGVVIGPKFKSQKKQDKSETNPKDQGERSENGGGASSF